jgi:nicotinate-nucleotide pyrophosphorylase (carboxylating)
VGAALEAVRAAHPDHDLPVQVEVDSLAQLDEALQHGAHQILLDNFDLDTLRAAVRRVRSVAPTTVLEASGGLRLENARATALTGVDLIAVGALTQSAPALDIGLDTAS